MLQMKQNIQSIRSPGYGEEFSATSFTSLPDCNSYSDWDSRYEVGTQYNGHQTPIQTTLTGPLPTVAPRPSLNREKSAKKRQEIARMKWKLVRQNMENVIAMKSQYCYDKEEMIADTDATVMNSVVSTAETPIRVGNIGCCTEFVFRPVDPITSLAHDNSAFHVVSSSTSTVDVKRPVPQYNKAEDHYKTPSYSAVVRSVADIPTAPSSPPIPEQTPAALVSLDSSIPTPPPLPPQLNPTSSKCLSNKSSVLRF